MSLGRVAREQGKSDDAIEALTKALQLDPGNVVAARLLADAYLALGEKLEALKKYKLVHALLPGEEDLEGVIEQLDNELNAAGIHMAFAEMRSRLQELTLRYGLMDTLDHEHFYPTLEAALEDIGAVPAEKPAPA